MVVSCVAAGRGAARSSAWAFQTANRLDRLHVRYDLSWQALDGALARRAVVARAVAVDAYGAALPEGRRLAALADAAERAPRTAREAAENELSAALALGRPCVAARGAGRRAGRCRGPGAAGPSLPQRRRPRHPGAARTARWCGCCVSAERRRCQPISRSPNARRRRRRRSGAQCVLRTSARVVLLDEDRRGAAVLRVGPGDRPTAPRRGGGSPSAAAAGRGAAGRGRGARAGRGDRVCGSTPAEHGRPDLAARRGVRLQRLGDPQRGVLLRLPHPPVRAVDRRAAPRWNGATSTVTGGVTRRCIAELVANGRDGLSAATRRTSRRGECAGRRAPARRRRIGSCSRSADSLRIHSDLAPTFRLDQ